MTTPRAALPNVTPIIIASAHRTMLGAKPENLVRIFELQAKELFGYVRKGAANHSEVVDALQTMAEESELVDLYGQDHVQAMMVAAAEDKGDSADTLDPSRDDAAPAKPDRKLISQRLSSIEAERIEYVWPGRLAAGKLTLIAGKPGVGKSNWVCFAAATVTTGSAWPCNEGRSPVGNVVVLSAEDGIADTIVPRMMAAGADLDRVEVIRGVEDENGRKTLDLKADIDLLEQKVREVGKVKLILIDPISAYMGKVDGHGNVETRGILEPLAEMADRLRVAVAAIPGSPRVVTTAELIAVSRVSVTVMRATALQEISP